MKGTQECCSKLKSPNARTEKDNLDQVDKGTLDDDWSDADEKMCSKEQQQARSSFEESERATSFLEAADGSENTGIPTATLDAASPAPPSFASNHTDFQQLLAFMDCLISKIDSNMADMNSKFSVFNARFEAVESTNDFCAVLSNSAMQLRGAQEKEKTADAP